ncbi:heparinase [Arthrobacter sp. Soil764]|nr:heparinase [Arthrobacter sp. Soil764]
MAVPPAGASAWHGVPAGALAMIREQAGSERGTPWPQPLVSHYARFFRDGNRTAYEKLVGGRQQRLTRAVVMALTAADREATDLWLDEVIDGAYLLCEQSSWSWAAHDDVYSRSGEVVPDLARPFLDLGAGEVAAQLGWLDHVLGSALDARAPGLRRRLRDEAAARVFQPFLERLDWHWLGLDGDVHNWNPWIHSNLVAAALFLVEDRHLQARIMERCVEGLDRFLASIPADGAIDEGFAYWWNGAGRALEGLKLLEEATGGTLDAGVPVVRELVAFPHRMHIGGSWFLNVADGPARAADALPWDMLHGWAERLGDQDAAGHAASMLAREPAAAAGLGRVLHSLLAASPGPAGAAPLVSFSYLPSVQIMVARQEAGSTEGLLLAAKGGHNGEHHNHRDVGSVVVAVDGVPLLVDAGQPTYTAKTFGPDRYDIRAMQSAWHSVPAPWGLEQGTGSEFSAHVLRQPTAHQPRLELALGAAYGLEPGQWVRSSDLDRNTGRVTIGDSWELPASAAPGTPDVDITYLTAGTLRRGPDGTATVDPAGIPTAATPGEPVGRGAVLRWDPATAVVLVDEWHLDDPLLADIWGPSLTRLRFRMPATSRANGAFTLTVEAAS